MEFPRERDSDFLICEDKDCEAKIKNHQWGKIKAEGWLELKDKRVYCPDHIPEWYAAWKKRKQRGH